jgi:hypothetical protein
MQDRKKWLAAALILALVGPTAAILSLPSARTAQAAEPAGDHWRNFDGHWSYWHEGDHRWYYTDGTHWFFHDGVHWAVYHFDKLFGVGFAHGGYHPPPPGAHVAVPRHDVFHR